MVYSMRVIKRESESPSWLSHGDDYKIVSHVTYDDYLRNGGTSENGERASERERERSR